MTTRFQAGQIANPKGRTPGTRSIADSLRREGQKRVKVGKHYVSKVDAVSAMVYDALVTFTAVSVDGKILKLSPKLWLDLVKFVSIHVDGPAKSELDITSGGQPLKTYVSFSPDQWDEIIDAEIVEDTKQLPSGK